eukprot:403344067
METALPEQLKSYPDPYEEEEKKRQEETQYTLPKLQQMARGSSAMELLQRVKQQNQIQPVTIQTVPSHKILEEYVKDSKFDPTREIHKEKHLTDFFIQKELLLNNYLANDEQEVKPFKSTIKTQFM